MHALMKDLPKDTPILVDDPMDESAPEKPAALPAPAPVAAAAAAAAPAAPVPLQVRPFYPRTLPPLTPLRAGQRGSRELRGGIGGRGGRARDRRDAGVRLRRASRQPRAAQVGAPLRAQGQPRGLNPFLKSSKPTLIPRSFSRVGCGRRTPRPATARSWASTSGPSSSRRRSGTRARTWTRTTRRPRP